MELKEKVAIELHKLGGLSVEDWDKLLQTSDCYECKDDYLQRAKELLPIIEAEVKAERERCLKVFSDRVKQEVSK